MRPLPASPASSAGAVRHPPHDVDEPVPARAGLRPDDRQRDLQRGDAAPGLAEVAAVQALEVGGARRVVAHHHVDHAVGKALPQRLPVGRLAHGRAALEPGVAVGHLLGGQRQVVRARLDGDGHAVGPGGREQRQRGGRGQVHHVHAGAGDAGGVEQPGDRRVLGGRGPRRDEVGVAAPCASVSSCAVLGVRDEQRPERRRARASRRSGSSSGGNSGTPLSTRKHLNPTTPASCSPRISSRLSGTAPPQNATSTWHCPAAAFRLTCSAATSTVGGSEFSGMSTIVVTPPAAAARGGRGEALPLGAARLVDVHVRVDEAWQQHLVAARRYTSVPLDRACPPAAPRRSAGPSSTTAAGCSRPPTTARRARSTVAHAPSLVRPPAAQLGDVDGRQLGVRAAQHHRERARAVGQLDHAQLQAGRLAGQQHLAQLLPRHLVDLADDRRRRARPRPPARGRSPPPRGSGSAGPSSVSATSSASPTRWWRAPPRIAVPLRNIRGIRPAP